jgi:hypothetical protein
MKKYDLRTCANHFHGQIDENPNGGPFGGVGGSMHVHVVFCGLLAHSVSCCRFPFSLSLDFSPSIAFLTVNCVSSCHLPSYLSHTAIQRSYNPPSSGRAARSLNLAGIFCGLGTCRRGVCNIKYVQSHQSRKVSSEFHSGIIYHT